MSGIEYRSAAALVTGQDAGSAAITVGGVAIPYDSDSQPLPFIESFAPGAFRDQLGDPEGFGGVTGQFMHDGVFVLASVDSQTMQVADSTLGLRYSMRIPGSLGYVREMVASGVTAGASIGFSAIEDEWGVDALTGYPRRLVTRAILAEISIVSSPAYKFATAAVTAGRSLAAPSETRIGKTISAATADRLQAVHDSLMDAALGLRDLIDVAQSGSPLDSDVGDGAVMSPKKSPADEASVPQAQDLYDLDDFDRQLKRRLRTAYGPPIKAADMERQIRARGDRYRREAFADLQRSRYEFELAARKEIGGV